jgi:hypothetical protein
VIRRADELLRTLVLYPALAVAGGACAESSPDRPSNPLPPCTEASGAAEVRSGGPGAGEGVQRVLVRDWRSPLGLTIRRYEIVVDGVPVHGVHQVEVYDQSGRLAHRAGTGDELLARLTGPGAPRPAALRHPLRGVPASTGPRSRPLRRMTRRPVWQDSGRELVAAVLTEQIDLEGADAPRGEVVLRDAATGAEIARHRPFFEAADPGYLVYVREDGRPLLSPLGDTFPHPTGAPDGDVPPPVEQDLVRQSMAADAWSDPWVPDSQGSENETWGNNVFAFYNSLLRRDGRMVTADPEVSLFDSPEYGPLPDDVGHDFFAVADEGRFVFTYDPEGTSSEYYQDLNPDAATPPAPDPDDPALNAKIVQAFYATNWLHDFFYSAGFDEVGGNAQHSNFGRGGAACDPLIIHAGFAGTFAYPALDGESPVLALGVNDRSLSLRDASMDMTIIGHEWGHTLIGRLAGNSLGDMRNLQGLSLHEGIADFIGVLVNLDGDDDLNGAFAVGSYVNLDYQDYRPEIGPGEAPADAMYYGIRRYPHSLDFARNPLTFRHLAEPPPAEVPFFNWKGRGPLLSEEHTAGEIFSQALFQCLGEIVAANEGSEFDELRTRMAQYLVAGLAAFPERPTFLEARVAILGVVRLANPTDHAACRAGFAARGMGADAIGPARDFGGDPPAYPPVPYPPVEESFLDQDRALRVTASTVTLADAGAGTLTVELRNTGLVDLDATSVELVPAVPAAVTLAGGSRVDLTESAPEQDLTATYELVLDPCLLPLDPAQEGARRFEYTISAQSSGEDPAAHERTFSAAVDSPSACDQR